MSYIFKWPKGPQEVIVTGSFDSWSKSLPLVKQTDGSFELQVPFKKSDEKIFYKYVVDGQWLVAKDQKVTQENSGIENNYFVADDLTVASASGSAIPESGGLVTAPVTGGKSTVPSGEAKTTVLPSSEGQHATIAGEPGIQIPDNKDAFTKFEEPRPTVVEKKLTQKEKRKLKRTEYKLKKSGKSVSPTPAGAPVTTSSEDKEDKEEDVASPEEVASQDIPGAFPVEESPHHLAQAAAATAAATAVGAAGAAGVVAGSTDKASAETAAAPKVDNAIAQDKSANVDDDVLPSPQVDDKTKEEVKEVNDEIKDVVPAAPAVTDPASAKELDAETRDNVVHVNEEIKQEVPTVAPAVIDPATAKELDAETKKHVSELNDEVKEDVTKIPPIDTKKPDVTAGKTADAGVAAGKSSDNDVAADKTTGSDVAAGAGLGAAAGLATGAGLAGAGLTDGHPATLDPAAGIAPVSPVESNAAQMNVPVPEKEVHASPLGQEAPIEKPKKVSEPAQKKDKIAEPAVVAPVDKAAPVEPVAAPVAAPVEPVDNVAAPVEPVDNVAAPVEPVEASASEPAVTAAPVDTTEEAGEVDATADDVSEEIVLAQGNGDAAAALALREGLDVTVEEIKPTKSEAEKLKQEANIPKKNVTSDPVAAGEGPIEKGKAAGARGKENAKETAAKKKSGFSRFLRKVFKSKD